MNFTVFESHLVVYFRELRAKEIFLTRMLAFFFFHGSSAFPSKFYTKYSREQNRDSTEKVLFRRDQLNYKMFFKRTAGFTTGQAVYLHIV